MTTAAPSVQLNICRELLRHARRLGPKWVPCPPASNQLWGRGFPSAPASAPHPLLARVTPPAIQGALCSDRPFASWLRHALRRGWQLASSNQPESQDEMQGVLYYIQNQSALTHCTSMSEEGGLRIEAVSGFVASHSNPTSGQFVFAYNMRFTNVGQRPLRVLAREYNFMEESGEPSSQIKLEQTEASGIVGFTPLLQPGRGFEFGSGCVLQGPRGSVTGKFLVMVEPELDGTEAKIHEAMEGAELMLRRVYYESLGTEQFCVPLQKLQFNRNVHCVSLLLTEAL